MKHPRLDPQGYCKGDVSCFITVFVCLIARWLFNVVHISRGALFIILPQEVSMDRQFI